MRVADIEIQSDKVVAAVKRRLAETLGDNLREVILFGSRSRGQAHPDSDYDFLVLVDRRSQVLEDQVHDIAYEMLDCYGAVVTLFVEESAHFEHEHHEPLLCNIRYGRDCSVSSFHEDMRAELSKMLAKADRMLSAG